MERSVVRRIDPVDLYPGLSPQPASPCAAWPAAAEVRGSDLAEHLERYSVNDAAFRGPQAGWGFGERQLLRRLSGRGGGVAKALIRRIRSGATAPWRRAARASCRQVNAPSVWALTSSSKEASLMSTAAMDRWRLVGLSVRRASSSSTRLGRRRQPAQAPPSSPRMVWECGPVASVPASGRIAERSSAVEYSSGNASIGARVGCVAATWRRRSVSALLQAQYPFCGGRRYQVG